MKNQTARNFFNTLVRDAKVQLKHSTAEVLAYMDQRAAHLQQNAADPGFDEMAATEMRNVAQFAGLEAVEVGDKSDVAARQRIFGYLNALLLGGI